MKIKVLRASDFTRKIEYLPEEVEKLNLKDIANRYGHADNGEVITVVNVETDEVIGRALWDGFHCQYELRYE